MVHHPICFTSDMSLLAHKLTIVYGVIQFCNHSAAGFCHDLQIQALLPEEAVEAAEEAGIDPSHLLAGAAATAVADHQPGGAGATAAVQAEVHPQGAALLGLPGLPADRLLGQ